MRAETDVWVRSKDYSRRVKYVDDLDAPRKPKLLLNALDKVMLKTDRRDATRTIYADLRDEQKVV